MDWSSLALLSAFSLASADAITKRYLSHYALFEIVITRFVVTAIILLPSAFLHPFPVTLPARFWVIVALLVPLEIVAMFLYMRAISIAPLSSTLPYMAFTPVFVTLTGYLILGEVVSVYGFFGIVLVVIGAWGLNLEYARRDLVRTWIAPFKAILTNEGSRLMLLTALIYSVTSVLGKAAMDYIPPEQFGPYYWVLIGFVILILFSIRRRDALTVISRQPVVHLVLGVFMAIMVLAHFESLAQIETAYMIAVKRTSLLFGILFGILFFKEVRGMQYLASGSLMVAGVVLIVL
ncbi:MAG: hypothetical protein BMS9Abin15_0648 [Gammaproteobacteria bacterium]|nr:MAG: hypothetical protein BMS9Abin15_0648 [Gammaproteobacteria bacterium]